MKMKKLSVVPKIILVVAVAVMFVAAMTLPANAQLTYTFGSYSQFGSATQGGGVASSGDWGTATFTDDGLGNVLLTLAVDSNLTSGQFLGTWYFNYNGDASSLSISKALGDTVLIGQSNNTYQPDGDGLYDLRFDFTPTDLSAGSSRNYTILNVSSSDFYLLSAPGTGKNGPFYAAVKLQGIQCDPANPDYSLCEGGTTSTFAAAVVPEPISSTLFVVGGALLGFSRFRKMRKA